MEERRSLFDHHRCAVTAGMEEQMRQMKSLCKELSQKCRRSYSLLDLNKKQIIHHYSAFGRNLKQALLPESDERNWEYVMRYFPEEDHYHICETDIRFYKLLMSVSHDTRQQLNMITLRRMQNKEGGYDIYLMRVFVTLSDDICTPWMLMIETEYLFPWKTEVFYPYCRIIMTNKTDSGIMKCFTCPGMCPLTEKQLEILEMAQHNDTLKGMAGHNDCNVNTLKTHKYGFIKRLNATTLTQALQVANLLRLNEKEKGVTVRME